MRRKKIQQIKNYSKTVRLKRQNGEIQEVCLNQQEASIGEQHTSEQRLAHFPKDEEFEDQFDDEFQDQEAWVSASSSDEDSLHDDGTMQSEEQVQSLNNPIINKKPKQQLMSEQPSKQQVFLGNNKMLQKGQILECDNRAYDMLHRLNIEWPALSVDFVVRNSPFDNLEQQCLQVTKYPLEFYTVQGSCAGSGNNSIYLSKLRNLHKTKYDDQEEGSDDEDDHNNGEAQIIYHEIYTPYQVNRIRTLNNSAIVGFWADAQKHGEVHLMDLTFQMQMLTNNHGSKKREKAKQIVLKFDNPGFAINWNTLNIGQLAVGSHQGCIDVLTNDPNFSSWSKTSSYHYHTSSVEDIVFSPEQKFIFASCSADKTLQIVDMRSGNYAKAQLKVDAHTKDVNVCDWNTKAKHLIVTGSDDCSVKVWDLRMFSKRKTTTEELLSFNWHTQPITSIRFQPNQESVIAVASEDNRLSIWDMAMQNEQGNSEIPNELMFLHQGQQEIKEVSFHPIYYEVLISSALDSINIFKPSYQMPDQDSDGNEEIKGPPIHEKDLDEYVRNMRLD